MESSVWSQLFEYVSDVDWQQGYRRVFAAVLIGFQVVLAWGIFGRIALLTAETGTVVIHLSAWVLCVRVLGIAILTAPTINAHLS